MAGTQSPRSEADFFIAQVREGRMSEAAAREAIGFTEVERSNARAMWGKPALESFAFREKVLKVFEVRLGKGKNTCA